MINIISARRTCTSLRVHILAIFVQWVEENFRPQPADLVDPEEYMRLAHALYRTMEPLLTEEQKERFKGALAKHLADEVMGLDPDEELHRRIVELSRQYPVVDVDKYERRIFASHRAKAVEEHLSGRSDVAAIHLAFLFRALGPRALELDRSVPHSVHGGIPQRGFLPSLVRQVLSVLHANPDTYKGDPETVRAVEDLKGYLARETTQRPP